MQRFPGPPGGSDPAVVKLQQQVTSLANKLAAMERCVQVDPSGTRVTIKAAAEVVIDGGAGVEIKGGGTIRLTAALINLN